MYSNDTKVLHLGDVASTGTNLVHTARANGRSWALRKLPAAPSLTSLSAWARRGTDALRYLSDGTKPELQHIHYGPNGYYGWLKDAPYVLHLHGTDLRQDLHRPLIGNVERAAVKHAAQLVVATPDLLEAARELDSSAIYVPNPLPPETYRRSMRAQDSPKSSTGQVFFSARWDDSKGGESLVDLAGDLVADGIEVVGVDWGTHAKSAKEAGVKMFPKMTSEDFEGALKSADVVIGQFSFGSLGMSELQCLALGRPLVGWIDPALEVGVPGPGTQIANAREHVEDLLNHPEHAKSGALEWRNWALAERSPQRTLRELEGIYKTILT